ncbi:hypothetical protein JCM11251_006530 [Rhodosporidiobolus azoricus]
MMASPSLLDYLTSSLASPFVASSLPGTHSYNVTLLRSQPQRSHALFPHATNAAKCKVYHEEVLVVLSEKRAVAKAVGKRGDGLVDQNKAAIGQAAAGSLNDGDEAKKAEKQADGGVIPTPSSALPASEATTVAGSAAKKAADPAGKSEGGEEHHQIPLVALEATIYTMPSTATTILYISKVDTTGLYSSCPPPTRALVSSFISYHLLYPPHSSTRVRIHIFARSQGQYLFPGSVENKGKRVLDDKGLCRWWKGTLERGVKRVEEERRGLPSPPVASSSSAVEPTPATKTNDDLRLFYLIPGLSYLESLPYIPLSPTTSTTPYTSWTYSHPYSTLSSPLRPAHIPPSSLPLPDLIPAFPDDPKSRFLHSLTSSAVSSSGTEGDYDDVFLALQSTTFTTGQPLGARKAAVESELERERKRLTEGVPGGVEEWWERMAFRQECCSGQLVGFFVAAAGEPSSASSAPSSASPAASLTAPPPSPSKHTTHTRPAPHPLALKPPLYTKLWSTFHNQSYDVPSLPSLAAGLVKWREDLERLCRIEYQGEGDEDVEKEKGGEEGWEKMFAKEVSRSFTVVGPAPDQAGAVKRPAADEAEKPKVNVLAPRKKKKKVE